MRFIIIFFEINSNKLNPKLKIFPLSAKTGEGVDAWCNWLREQVRAWNG